MVSPIVKSRKSESPPTPRKRAISFKADMAPEEVFYRSMKPPCPFCGQMNTKFRYFNNSYRTPGTRISNYEQPRFRCLSTCSKEFILGGRKKEKKQRSPKTKNGDIIVRMPESTPTNDGNCARTMMTIYTYN